MIVGPEPLARHHSLDQFDCGKPALTDWLRRYARMNQGAGMTQTYVVHLDNRVIGYYSLCPGSIERQSAIPRILKGIAGHANIPIILLARLAIDVSEHGKGLGAALLKDAFQRAINAAAAIAGRAIIVHAIDDDAVRFYEHFDFAPSPNDDRTLMILMKDVRAMLGS
ncbi:MAG: GNAT family N-acetyltransferase [Woeseiaceae bacterium]|nr:GNAT family N-acetyltransferase [Woeseiaceae bacterium]